MTVNVVVKQYLTFTNLLDVCSLATSSIFIITSTNNRQNVVLLIRHQPFFVMIQKKHFHIHLNKMHSVSIAMSHLISCYKFCTAQTPNAIVAMSPPNENRRIGASPPSKVVPTRSPTFLAYLLLGPEHWGHLNPGPCSSKYMPAHSARL